MMKRKLGLVAAATAALVVLAGCSATPPADEGGKDITLWVMGGDTPDALRDYLKTEYASATGGTLTIEQQDWSDALSKLTTALPDPENTPDVVEIGNTWSPTFTSVGAFSDITDLVPELGGDKLLPRSSRSARWTAPTTHCPTTSVRATCSTARTSGPRLALRFPPR